MKNPDTHGLWRGKEDRAGTEDGCRLSRQGELQEAGREENNYHHVGVRWLFTKGSKQFSGGTYLSIITQAVACT